jgi:hypothetical protein
LEALHVVADWVIFMLSMLIDVFMDMRVPYAVCRVPWDVYQMSRGISRWQMISVRT